MNRKKIILIISLVAVGLVGLSVFSYFYQNSPKAIVEKTLNEDQDEANRYLTDEFLAKIREDSPSNKEFLDNAVSDYSVTEKIDNITTNNNSDGTKTSTVTILTTTTNIRTGFSVSTNDMYTVLLVKNGLGWQISDYQLISSKTLD